jgi:hypothetical protein
MRGSRTLGKGDGGQAEHSQHDQPEWEQAEPGCGDQHDEI